MLCVLIVLRLPLLSSPSPCPLPTKVFDVAVTTEGITAKLVDFVPLAEVQAKVAELGEWQEGGRW